MHRSNYCVGGCRNKMIGIWTKRSHLDRFRRINGMFTRESDNLQTTWMQFSQVFNARCESAKEFTQ